MQPFPHASAEPLSTALPVDGVAHPEPTLPRGRLESRPPLPAALTPLIGRQAAVDEVQRRLVGTLCLTLTGPGGTGKTRLALAVAEGAAPAYADGVAWVEFAPVDDPALVPRAVAAALGVVEQPGRDAATAVAEYCRTRRLLVVLDNCEHVVGACATFVLRLLLECPGLRVLATSREPLGVEGEVTWPVPPLAVPSADALRAAGTPGGAEALGRVDAVRLFVERAEAALPTFALTAANAEAVAQICRRLDGLPLAVEIAAARVRAFTPRQIAARLDDAMRLLRSTSHAAPPRQRTLEAVVEWSYGLLTVGERRVLAELSVFAGGWTLEAVEAVCGRGGQGRTAAPFEALDLLVGLIDKSLVVVEERDGDARYALLETIRQYAAARLAEQGEADDVRRRHAAYYASLAEAAGPHLTSGAREAWEPRLRAEGDNLRAALAWSTGRPAGTPVEEAGGTGVALRIVAALWPLWLIRTAWREGREWAEAALTQAQAAPAGIGEAPDAQAPGADGGAARAAALTAAGTFAWVAGDLAPARARLEDAVARCRALGDGQGLSVALAGLAKVMADLGAADPGAADMAAVLAGESVVAARASGSAWHLAAALTGAAAYVAQTRGDAPGADAALREAEAAWLAAEDAWGLAITRHGLAELAWRRGELAEAARLAADSVAAVAHLRDPYFVARGLWVAALVAAAAGELARAARLLGAEEAMRDAIGAHVLPFERPLYDATVRAARDALGADAYAATWADGRALALDGAAALVADAPHLPSTRAPAGPPAPVPLAPVPPAAPIVPDTAVAAPTGPALEVRALGPLEVLRHGTLLTAVDWQLAKARELFAYLLCHPKGRTREQIGLALWPDVSASQLRGSFHVTLYHLRRAIGGNAWVTFRRGQYAFDRAGSYAYDVERFEAAVAEARRAAPGGAAERQRAAALYAEAVALYRGDFLQGDGAGGWAEERHDVLRRTYLDALLALGELQLAEGDAAAAFETYRAALRQDPLWEAAHRGVMRCLARVGHRGEALRHHARFAALLHRELGAEPAAETADVVDEIRRGVEA